MKYIVVQVSKNGWIVAERSAHQDSLDGPFRASTKSVSRDVAEKIYNNLRFLGRNNVPQQFEHLMVR